MWSTRVCCGLPEPCVNIKAALSWYEGFRRLTEDREGAVANEATNNSTGDFQTCCRLRLIVTEPKSTLRFPTGVESVGT